jgi:hypothetical protein
VSAGETNCFGDGESGAADETDSCGIVVSLEVGYPAIDCCVGGGWFTTAERHGVRTLFK